MSPTPKPTAVPETHEPTPQQKAADLRKEALVNVQKWYFDLLVIDNRRALHARTVATQSDPERTLKRVLVKCT